VEDVLNRHDEVTECSVVGEPDEEKGEVVKAFVARVEKSDVSAEALQNHCRMHLAPYETPRKIEFVDALPRSYLGKVLKYRMRQAYDGQPGGNGERSAPARSHDPRETPQESADAPADPA